MGCGASIPILDPHDESKQSSLLPNNVFCDTEVSDDSNVQYHAQFLHKEVQHPNDILTDDSSPLPSTLDVSLHGARPVLNDSKQSHSVKSFEVGELDEIAAEKNKIKIMELFQNRIKGRKEENECQ
ncbi:hypothetical protein P9112_006388 [Eukaryota sp. TZLM1-RC]